MSRPFRYHAGRKGKNRVTAFRHKSDDKLYLEWWEFGRRKSKKLAERVQRLDRRAGNEEAETRAEELAAELARLESVERQRAPSTTLEALIDRYGREKTPTKGKSKQGHDKRSSRLFLAFFDAQSEPARRSSREPQSLDAVDWDRFIIARRAGTIPGFSKPVGDRQITYDLKHLIAVLNWALGVKVDGVALLESNPWGGSLRRAQRWTPLPQEQNPHRPSMPKDLEELLIEHGSSWQFGVALQLGRVTGRRNSSIRQLRWSDIDLTRAEVVWRGETDKVGLRQVVPLAPRAVDILRNLEHRGIGDAPIFPSATDPTQPTPRDTFQGWLKRAKARAIKAAPESQRDSLRLRLRGVGFHAEKRSFVRDPEFRNKPPKVQEAFVGTNHETLRKVYDEVTPDDLRAAMGFTSGPQGDANREGEPRVS